MGEFMNVFTGLECFIEILLLFLYKVICFGSVESEFNFWLKLFQIRVKNLLGCVVHITAKIILVFTKYLCISIFERSSNDLFIL